jgi:fucokinase
LARKEPSRRPGYSVLIEQGYRESWTLYQQSLEVSSARRPQWDWIILTAADEHQAHAFELQIAQRRKAGLLPPATQVIVIADPAGKRIGSGGATIHALAQLARKRTAARRGVRDFSILVAGLRVLLLHSGGESRRLPHCSAFGKVFARVPHELPDGRPSTLFDEFLVSLSGVPYRMHEGVLVASGDVLLLFDHSQLNLSRQGVVGVAAGAPAETGSRHGVYIADPRDGVVRQLLHKASVAELKAAGAMDDEGKVAIDSGLVWMDPAVIARMLEVFGLGSGLEFDDGSLYAKVVKERTALNFYGDLLVPLAAEAEREAYLSDNGEDPAPPALAAVRERVWEGLRNIPFHLQTLAPAEFVHFNTTTEYLSAVTDGLTAYRSLDWTTPVASFVELEGGPVRSVIQGSSVPHLKGAATCRSVVENCSLTGRIELADSCLLSHVWSERDLALEPHTVIHQLPVMASDDGRPRGFVTRIYGERDNPKLAVDDPAATFLGRPWAQWLAAAEVVADDLWEEAENGGRTLWQARLYPISKSREESLALVLWMLHPEQTDPKLRRTWLAAPRMSMAESAGRADMIEIIANLQQLDDLVRVQRYFALIKAERPSREAMALLGDRAADVRRRAYGAADLLARENSLILDVRGYKYLADALHAQGADRACLRDAQRFEDRAFESLSEAIRHSTPWAGDAPKKRPGGAPARAGADVQAAARIDFAGGWSDTPPFSIEYGGAVLNAAIRLHGTLPIRVACEPLDRPVLVLESRDLGVSREYTQAADILAYDDPSDPLALHKAAVVLQGLVSHREGRRGREPLARTLGRLLGGGLRVTTSVNVPAGSGLGTSSILAGALLAGLRRVLGRPVDQAAIYDEVLCLEQMLTTGGGWQDQVGGMFGGIKLATTKPGLPQRPAIDPVRVKPKIAEEFARRFVLLYTGQRRLAKGILRAVMGRFMSRDPEALEILTHIRDIAREQRKALARGDLDEMGRLLAEHWELNKRLDPGMTNLFIDHLFKVCAPFSCGAKLAGAGGGGFMMIMARDDKAPRRLAEAVREAFPKTDIAPWPCEIAEPALEITERTKSKRGNTG